MTALSREEFNRLKALAQHGGAEGGMTAEEALRKLEPYRVRRAILMAAGFGSRMQPVTLDTPKPLVRVNGERIIDSLIDACLSIGVEDIYIVRGYLGDQFDQLLKKYPGLHLVDNPLYSQANNISSVLAVRDFLENAYVLEADLLISNASIIEKYHYSSEFLGIPVAHTDDWCFAVENGIIASQAIGGSNCHQMVGISYWSAADGARLCDDIVQAYEAPGGTELFWEQVPMKLCRDRYRVAIRECRADDVTEIDTLEELCALDPSYLAFKPGVGL